MRLPSRSPRPSRSSTCKATVSSRNPTAEGGSGTAGYVAGAAHHGALLQMASRLAMTVRFRRPVEETMTRCLTAATAGLLGVLGVMTHAPVQAAEIVVLTNLGVVSAVRDLAPAFERASGHKVIVSFELGNAMLQKINSNAPADLVTQTPDVIDSLIKQGKVVGERVDFARAGIGVAVKPERPSPTSAAPTPSSARCSPPN